MFSEACLRLQWNGSNNSAWSILKTPGPLKIIPHMFEERLLTQTQCHAYVSQ